MLARIGGSVLAASILLLAIGPSFPRIASEPAENAVEKAVIKPQSSYVCPMHPDVKSNSPGKCPKCGMTLELAPSTKNQTPAAGAKGESASALAFRMKIPDTQVSDQNGRKLRFYTDLVKNNTVVIEFIFTSCTTICPPLTAVLRQVQQQLGDRVGSGLALVSVTVDPAYDTPERLKEFADRFRAGPGWSFVTGSQSDIDDLLKSLGGYAADRTQHSPMILIGNDSAGYWTRTYGLAPPSKLVQLINDAAARPASHPSVAGPSGPVLTPAQAAAHYFPNPVLFTQDNKSVHFYDDLIQQKVVLIDFMFTTCTGICPSMTANLARVRHLLAGHVGRDVNIISITVDPAVDTPQELRKYAEFYGVDGPGWYFLTGAKKDVDQVLYKLGGYAEDKNDHSTFLIIGNAETGQWMKMFAMARPDQIAEAVMTLLNPPTTPPGRGDTIPR
ncbi:MAG TPA: SCO family protein [Blastocatellia bacterium]|nr:SCO family protein [Blastocatellia bacterium]